MNDLLTNPEKSATPVDFDFSKFPNVKKSSKASSLGHEKQTQDSSMMGNFFEDTLKQRSHQSGRDTGLASNIDIILGNLNGTSQQAGYDFDVLEAISNLKSSKDTFVEEDADGMLVFKSNIKVDLDKIMSPDEAKMFKLSHRHR